MKAWFIKFWSAEGKRLFYLFLVFLSGTGFILLGSFALEGDQGQQLIGSGITQLLAVGALALNKARSEERPPTERQN